MMAKIDGPGPAGNAPHGLRPTGGRAAAGDHQTDAFAPTPRVGLEDILVKARMVQNLAACTAQAPEDDVFGLMDTIRSLVRDIERLNGRA